MWEQSTQRFNRSERNQIVRKQGDRAARSAVTKGRLWSEQKYGSNSPYSVRIENRNHVGTTVDETRVTPAKVTLHLQP